MARLDSSEGKAARPCPDCGAFLQDDSDECGGRYECHNNNCGGSGVYFERDGVIADANSRTSDPVTSCQSCQQPLRRDRIDLTSPWEDGDNRHAYFVCPFCGHENILYGFGGDD